MKPILPFFIMLTILIVPFSIAVTPNSDTYVLVNTMQPNFAGGVKAGGNVYFIEGSAIYELNLTTQSTSEVFYAGTNYVFSSIVEADNLIYVAGYKLYNPATNSSSPGGGGFIPVSTVKTASNLPEQDYGISNFTVWILSPPALQTISRCELNINISSESYFHALKAMKLLNLNNTVYAVLLSNEYNTATSYIYKVEYTGNLELNQIATFNTSLSDAAGYGDDIYLIHYSESGSKLYVYSISSNAVVNTYTEDTISFIMNSVYVDSQYIYLAGYDATNSNDWKAAVQVQTHDFAQVFYRTYSDATQFFTVYAVGKYVAVGFYEPTASENILYLIDYKNSTTDYIYQNSFQHGYDIATHNVEDLSSYTPYVLTISAWVQNGTYQFAWGGYYYANSVMQAYVILTKKPSNVPNLPDDNNTGNNSGGGGLPPIPSSTFGQIWEKYQYEIIAAGAILFLFVASGGRRE